MKPFTSPYAQPNPAKNFLLLMAGAVGFFLLLVVVEPLAYFSHYKNNTTAPRPQEPGKRQLAAAAALVTASVSNNDKKTTDKTIITKPAAPPLTATAASTKILTAEKQAAIVKAAKNYLKRNDTRNSNIVKELSGVTDMKEFHFKNGHAQLDEKAVLTKLDSSLQQCIAAPESWRKIIVLGFTDNRGTKISNVKLGMKRAERFKTWLVKKGIPAEKITVASFGPELPIATNTDAEGRAKNRRVEFNLLGTGG